MFAQLERLAVESTGGIENGITIDEAPVPDGYAHVLFRPQFAVEIDHVFPMEHGLASYYPGPFRGPAGLSRV